MKDEIKEILAILKSRVQNNGYLMIGVNNCKLLLDYITNLQTIEQQYSALLSENAELENKITNLQEENENRISESLSYDLAKAKTKEIREKNIFLQDKIEKYKKSNEEYIELNKELYYRIDKAIEYIENDMPYLEEPDDDYENNHKMVEYDNSVLLNILQGSDE